MEKNADLVMPKGWNPLLWAWATRPKWLDREDTPHEERMRNAVQGYKWIEQRLREPYLTV